MSKDYGNQQSFMKNIASRLGRKEPLAQAPIPPAMGVPSNFANIQMTRKQKIQLFTENWNALSGHTTVVQHSGAENSIIERIKKIAEEKKVQNIARWTCPELDQFDFDTPLRNEGVNVYSWEKIEENKVRTSLYDPSKPSAWQSRSPILRTTEACEMGIVWADYAIAGTGTLALFAKGGKGRSVSLMPSILVAVFTSEQLVVRMGEIFSQMKENENWQEKIVSSINFVTGPSRSADIEGDLTIGVHGPGEVYAIIIE